MEGLRLIVHLWQVVEKLRSNTRDKEHKTKIDSQKAQIGGILAEAAASSVSRAQGDRGRRAKLKLEENVRESLIMRVLDSLCRLQACKLCEGPLIAVRIFGL